MICPYNDKQHTTVLQWTQNSEDEEIIHLQQIENINFTPMECPKDGCAVWYDGKCHYAANTNNE